MITLIGFSNTLLFQEFYDSNDARGAIRCLKCILERARLDGGRVLYEYLNNLMVVAIHAKDYEAALLVRNLLYGILCD